MAKVGTLLLHSLLKNVKPCFLTVQAGLFIHLVGLSCTVMTKEFREFLTSYEALTDDELALIIITELVNQNTVVSIDQSPAKIAVLKAAFPAIEPVIVFVSSGLAHMPIADLASYCATKSAMHFFAMSLRHQLRSLSIEVVEVLTPRSIPISTKTWMPPKWPPIHSRVFF